MGRSVTTVLGCAGTPGSPNSPTARLNATGSSFTDPQAVTFNNAPRVHVSLVCVSLPMLQLRRCTDVGVNEIQQGSYSKWASSTAKTMGGKLAAPARLMTPGPGAYSPTSSMMHAAPRYSLSPRRNHVDHMAFVPGPGAYDPSNPAHKPRGVALGQKINVFGAGTVTPGPAAYNVDDLTALNRGSGSNIGTKGGRRGAPSWSFGLKVGC